MVLVVDRPPSTEASALAVAAEHYAFCGSDGFQAYDERVDSVRDLARVILDQPLWRFWWD